MRGSQSLDLGSGEVERVLPRNFLRQPPHIHFGAIGYTFYGLSDYIGYIEKGPFGVSYTFYGPSEYIGYIVVYTFNGLCDYIGYKTGVYILDYSFDGPTGYIGYITDVYEYECTCGWIDENECTTQSGPVWS